MKADWQKFHGNHHHVIDVKEAYGGYVSFAKHIGKKLSQELWDDLVHRLMVERIAVYGPNDYEWTIAWPECNAIVRLDGCDLVTDIELTPCKYRWIQKHLPRSNEKMVDEI